ncbi:MAG TPA: hypothetical protein VHK23_07060 [Miltoncostaeaceae bacterium]|nr:hypothetical protein [Miltoncostaeaceae bacterium]
MTRRGSARYAWLVAAAVIFMVVSEEQLEAARAVAGHLPSPPTVVNPYTGVAAPLAEMTDVRRPVGAFPTPRAIGAARATLRRSLELAGAPHPVLVAGQDVGTIERVAIASARRAGARVAIMPDGVFASERLGAGRRPLERAISAADRALVAAGVLAGRRSDFGSTAPDMILSWGPGWEAPLQRRAPAARIVNCGSPRSDAFARLPPRPGEGRVLLCSQPLFLGQAVAPPSRETVAWYDWLTAMARVDDPRVRVRLHPGERAPAYPLPGGLRHLLGEPHRPLAEDLAWADVVLAPFSSVLVEAAGASRIPISAGSTAVWGDFAANAFLQDPRVPSVDFRASPGLDDLLAVAAETAPGIDALRDDYLANAGDAARRNADAIAALATAQKPGAAGRARRL